MRTPNLTLIFLSIATVTVFGLAGGVTLTVTGNDPASFYGFFTATLASVIGFAGIIGGLNKIQETNKAIETKVNGNLTKLIDLAVAKANPEHAGEAVAIGESLELHTGSTPTLTLTRCPFIYPNGEQCILAAGHDATYGHPVGDAND